MLVLQIPFQLDLRAGQCAMSCSNPQLDCASDAITVIVHSLMCHRQSGESEEFARRAIESLVKKLKEKQDDLESLITAITTSGNQPSKCVTIQRTLDGRMQIAGRKCLPHVIYSRIWRWPDLHRNELRHSKDCCFGFELKQDYVCINPYHYERVVSPVDLAALSLSPVVEKDDMCSDAGSESNCPESLVSGFKGTQIADMESCLPGVTTDEENNHINSPALVSAHPPLTVLDLDDQLTHTGNTNGAVNNNSNKRSGSSTGASGGCSAGGSSFTGNAPCGGAGGAAGGGGGWGNRRGPPPPPFTPSGSILQPLPVLTTQRPPEYWCNIAYFELDQQVGELFKVPSQYSRVTVDGYTDPSSPNRFCLGQLSNVHRSEQSEKSRLYIGKGVELDNVGEGDVWIRCLSEFSVFVQSYYLDREAGRAPGDAVHKIYPGAYIKVKYYIRIISMLLYDFIYCSTSSIRIDFKTVIEYT
ncbi:unnamed protein product [Heterobilharzia americana]|nr:unnamed protein product [Heterobilharzia americana]